jgi:hypothetical protein
MTQITRIAVMLPLPSCFGGAVSCRIGETTKPQGVLLDCFVNAKPEKLLLETN